VQPGIGWNIEHYIDAYGRVPFDKWWASQRDKKGLGAIEARLTRIADKGNFGSREMLGDGVWELKIDVGPGYRVYFGLDNVHRSVVLLGAGDKSTQKRDIKECKKRWKDYNA
jgi:putative addiction module killer protein